MSDQNAAATPAASTPEAMRQSMASYVRAVHGAYLDAAGALPPAERARLPLMASTDLTVIAVGARYLHVIATTEALPRPEGQEIEMSDETGGVAWRLRFYDPVIVPALGLVDESQGPESALIREVLGVRTVVYHLSVSPGGGLTAHHAMHAGTGLAHAHAAADRDFETIASLAPGRLPLVAEMHGASVAGLLAAQVLLAREIDPASAELAALDPMNADPDEVRRTLLASLRRVGP